MRPSPTDGCRARGASPGRRRPPGPVVGACLLGLLALPRPAPAQQEERSDAGSLRESAVFLLVPLGARNVGAGGTVAAVRGEIEGALWNPASLAGVDRPAVWFHASNDFGSDMQAAGGLVRWRGLRIGVGLQHFDAGTIDARDARNGDLGTLELKNQAFMLSVALSARPGLHVGAGYKLVRLASECVGGCGEFDETTIGHAFDVGAIAAVPWVTGLDAGLVLRSLGPGIRFAGSDVSDPLPTRIRAGVAWALERGPLATLLADTQTSVSVRADVRQTVTEFDDFDLFLGAEAGFRETLFVRAGHAWAGEGRRGPSLGLGLRVDPVRLDVGRAFDDFAGFGEDEAYQISLGVGL